VAAVMRGLQAIAFSVVVIRVSAGGVGAQEFRGTILGRVTDPQGAAVPGVTVVVTNQGTNVSAEAVTQSDGAYASGLQDLRALRRHGRRGAARDD
jgi:Carboxypeptidase regulatory-like domain